MGKNMVMRYRQFLVFDINLIDKTIQTTIKIGFSKKVNSSNSCRKSEENDQKAKSEKVLITPMSKATSESSEKMITLLFIFVLLYIEI